jgi:hypothetical protein
LPAQVMVLLPGVKSTCTVVPVFLTVTLLLARYLQANQRRVIL